MNKGENDGKLFFDGFEADFLLVEETIDFHHAVELFGSCVRLGVDFVIKVGDFV